MRHNILKRLAIIALSMALLISAVPTSVIKADEGNGSGASLTGPDLDIAMQDEADVSDEPIWDSEAKISLSSTNKKFTTKKIKATKMKTVETINVRKGPNIHDFKSIKYLPYNKTVTVVGVVKNTKVTRYYGIN